MVVGAINAMKNIDACTLWRIVQWGTEYLARFKASPTAIEELDAYKNWTQTHKAKRLAGFTATLRSAPGSTPGSAKKASVDSD